MKKPKIHFMCESDFKKERESWDAFVLAGYKGNLFCGKILCGEKDAVGASYAVGKISCKKCVALHEAQEITKERRR